MKRIEVTAGVIIDNDKVLITRRAPEESYAGGWEFPGGKIKANEAPAECLARELKEELDIDVSVGELCTNVIHDYDNLSISLSAYYCSIIKGDITISVHDKFEWVKINDLLKYELLPADIPIAEKIIKDGIL